MKKTFLFLLVIISIKTYSQDSLIVNANVLTDNLNIYSDSLGINKIGDIQSKYVFLISPSNIFTYYIYAQGLLGYVSPSNLEFNKNTARGLTKNNIDWKIKEAKKREKVLNIEIDSLRHIDSILNIKKNKNDSILNIIKNKNDSIKYEKSIQNELDKGLRNKLQITEFTITGNDYQVGFNIGITNYVKKTIKYSYITIAGYNDVKDIEAKKTFKCVGPINFVTTANYSFENAFYSKVITSLKITKIQIEYMDGSKKDFIGQELKQTLTYDYE